MLRYTFLEFVTPSPFSLWFYQAMGMQIGPGTVINSTHISDPSLIEIGSKVTIGGSATIVAHYGQSGYLVLAPVKIGNGVTVGLRATIMGGVIIGDNAKILPNSVLLPKTIVPANEVWGGVPAHKYELRKLVS
jgi:acetyltransferase-like isoleucine patch superfamily enzyme